VEAISTNWSFGAMGQPNPAPCLLVAPSASVLADSMKISDESSGREEKGTPNARRQAITMLYASFHCIMARRSRAKQKRNALHLMTLSGVIRPSHIELRYGTRTTGFPALGRHFTATETAHSASHAPALSWYHDIQIGTKQIWQWMRIPLGSVMQSTRKPIGPQWNTD
jgi:hypothetical protein